MKVVPTFRLEKRDKPIALISTSDWHLGHRKVSTLNLCNRIRKYLFPQIEHCQILNLGGDIWDTLLMLCDDTNMIEALLIDLMRLCEEFNVVVRILLGTYSHDRGQSTLFTILHEKCGFKNDLRYIDTVYLEEIKSLNLRILYLPDDLPYESSYDCLKVVEGMMESLGWKYVDYVFGHGYFDYMLPPHIPRKPRCTFFAEQFAPFVRRFVCFGHIHMNDYRENVFYNNSFDRLAHGEEEPKGFMYVVDYGDTARLEFIENKDATKFITIDLSSYSDKDEIGKIYLEKVEALFGQEAGYVRVNHPSSEIRQALNRLTSARFPKLGYSFKKLSDTKIIDTSKTHQKLLDVKSYPAPNEDTLPKMVFDFNGTGHKGILSLERTAEILATL